VKSRFKLGFALRSGFALGSGDVAQRLRPWFG
jgi:hypothetical protein